MSTAMLLMNENITPEELQDILDRKLKAAEDLRDELLIGAEGLSGLERTEYLVTASQMLLRALI